MMGETVKIKNIRKKGKGTVRNLNVQNNSTFVSGNGIVTHNCDNLSAHFMQALRGFMEEFSSNCRFILTANFRNRIIDPIQSRCTTVEFGFDDASEEKQALADMFKRTVSILEHEGVKYEKKPLVKVLQKYFPDFRKTLNELERYASSHDTIDSGVLDNIKDAKVEDLIGLLKDKDFTGMRQWVAENKNTDLNNLLRRIYDNLYDFLDSGSIPDAVLIINDTQVELNHVADKEICVVAGLTKLMLECSFK